MIDLTLGGLMVPGLVGYTPPFGTKLPDGKGLSTMQVNNNVLMPFAKARNIMVSETEETSGIDFDAKLVIANPSITLTLGVPSFDGCCVTVMTAFSSGTSLIVSGNVTRKISPDEHIVYIFKNGKWMLAEFSAAMLNFGICDTAEGDMAKSVFIPGIELKPGLKITVKFTNPCGGLRGVYNLTLALNSGEAVPVFAGNYQCGIGAFGSEDLYDFIYDGARWCIQSNIVAREFSDTEGYIKQSNGVIVQWMNRNFVYSNKYSFPLPFTTPPALTGSPYSGETHSVVFKFLNLTPSDFDFRGAWSNQNDSGGWSGKCSVLAIGV